jgi:DNA polymerase III subunit epsilon
MNLKLEKDLCFFDLETTGSDVYKDRIVQIALIKYPKDGSGPIERKYLVNPLQPISIEATLIHGISNDMVRDAAPFKLLAVEIFDFIGDSDLGGYNSNRFDIPLLIEEFSRVGLTFSLEGRRLIDALQIFYKMEPRTLQAALKFYCGKTLEQAHDALADTRATAEVFFGQLEYYKNTDWSDPQTGDLIEKPIRNDIQFVHDFINGNDNRVDLTGRFVRNDDGIIIFNFGNQKGQAAHLHPNVLRWIIDKDFPLQVKNIARDILNGKMK